MMINNIVDYDQKKAPFKSERGFANRLFKTTFLLHRNIVFFRLLINTADQHFDPSVTLPSFFCFVCA